MLMLNLVVILLFSLGMVGIIYKEKERIKAKNIHAHIVVMSMSMILSMAFGFLMGIIMVENYALATMIAIVYGMLIAYLIGGIFGPYILIGGLAEGIMGAVMGTMTGNMILMSANVTAIIIFLDVLFLLLIGVFLHVIYRSADKETREQYAVVE